VAVVLAALTGPEALPKLYLVAHGQPQTAVITRVIAETRHRSVIGHTVQMATLGGAAVPGELNSSADDPYFKGEQLDIFEDPDGLVDPQLADNVRGTVVGWTVPFGLAVALLAWMFAVVGLGRPREPRVL
jgi:hypothetical protein